MKENLIHYRTCVCNINYHVVWSVKYRRKVLTKEIEDYMRQVVYETAAEKGFTVHEFECGQMDHVHCFVSAPPKLSITQIVKYLKGISGRKLYERFPEIRQMPLIARNATTTKCWTKKSRMLFFLTSHRWTRKPLPSWSCSTFVSSTKVDGLMVCSPVLREVKHSRS